MAMVVLLAEKEDAVVDQLDWILCCLVFYCLATCEHGLEKTVSMVILRGIAASSVSNDSQATTPTRHQHHEQLQRIFRLLLAACTYWYRTCVYWIIFPRLKLNLRLFSMVCINTVPRVFWKNESEECPKSRCTFMLSVVCSYVCCAVRGTQVRMYTKWHACVLLLLIDIQLTPCPAPVPSLHPREVQALWSRTTTQSRGNASLCSTKVLVSRLDNAMPCRTG